MLRKTAPVDQRREMRIQCSPSARLVTGGVADYSSIAGANALALFVERLFSLKQRRPVSQDGLHFVGEYIWFVDLQIIDMLSGIVQLHPLVD
jgi:hypothetical protein